MRCLLRLPLLVAVATFCAHAVAADPMDSVRCRQARAELDAVLSGASNTPESARQLARARSGAARECLGPLRPGLDRKRSGAPQPAQAVPLPQILAAPPTPVQLPAPPASPPPAERPAHVTHCDAAGCWDSEGHRLNQVGPLLVGPHGPCNLQGSIVSCP